MSGKRLVRIAVVPELLGQILTDGEHPRGFAVSGGLPEGATFDHARWEHAPFRPDSGTVDLYFGHESFAPVAEGGDAPYLTPVVSTGEGRLSAAAPALRDALKALMDGEGEVHDRVIVARAALALAGEK